MLDTIALFVFEIYPNVPISLCKNPQIDDLLGKKQHLFTCLIKI